MRGKKEGLSGDEELTDTQTNPCFWVFPKEDLHAAQAFSGLIKELGRGERAVTPCSKDSVL
jgi:hypothetical protein